VRRASRRTRATCPAATKSSRRPPAVRPHSRRLSRAAASTATQLSPLQSLRWSKLTPTPATSRKDDEATYGRQYAISPGRDASSPYITTDSATLIHTFYLSTRRLLAQSVHMTTKPECDVVPHAVIAQAIRFSSKRNKNRARYVGPSAVRRTSIADTGLCNELILKGLEAARD